MTALPSVNTISQIRFVWKPLVFVLCLIPATLVFTDAFEITGRLGANPIEEIQDRFGYWGLRFVLITLSMTPLRHITGSYRVHSGRFASIFQVPKPEWQLWPRAVIQST